VYKGVVDKRKIITFGTLLMGGEVLLLAKWIPYYKGFRILSCHLSSGGVTYNIEGERKCNGFGTR
jgi:hypothetical protein